MVFQKRWEFKRGEEMYRVAIIEDDKEWQARLKEYLEGYGKENAINFSVSLFDDGLDFLMEYLSNYDIIFLDIEMAHSNGLEVAKKIRAKDEGVPIIFVTNMAQYALKGYEVAALDFIVKPANYYDIVYRIEKALHLLERNKKDEIILTCDRQIRKINISDIYYVEVKKHQLIYHTAKENIEVWGSLSKTEEQLKKYGFCKCNSGYLVNLHYVDEIKGNEVRVNGEWLLISRPKRAEFINQLTLFVGA